jgi:hypothetical protein
VTGLSLGPVLESDSNLFIDKFDVPERERKLALPPPLRAGVAIEFEGRWINAESE